jgi:hypothetical protein
LICRWLPIAIGFTILCIPNFVRNLAKHAQSLDRIRVVCFERHINKQLEQAVLEFNLLEADLLIDHILIADESLDDRHPPLHVLKLSPLDDRPYEVRPCHQLGVHPLKVPSPVKAPVEIVAPQALGGNRGQFR